MKLVPRLRFPEFVNEEWKIESFGNIYSFKGSNSLSREALNYENGSVRNIHYGDIHTKFQTLFDLEKERVPFINASISTDKFKSENFLLEGDMVYADASEDLNDVGKSIEIVDLKNEKVVSGLHTLLARQKDSKFVIGFGGHLFGSTGIRSQIQREAQGAKVYGISAGRLAGIKVYYPNNKDEQQKIADCLSSLDELVAAECTKLKALKAHKKGLMQQLFPAEGETVPQLRFAGFEGEWEERKFGKVIKIVSGKGFKASEYSNNGIRLLQIENVGYGRVKWNSTPICLPYSYSNEFNDLVLKVGDIVLALNRPVTNNELKIARIQQVDNPCLLYQRVGKIELLTNSLISEFVFQLGQRLIKDFVVKQSIGSDQPFISLKDLYNQSLLFPTVEEQQKIAECLSSLNELITA